MIHSSSHTFLFFFNDTATTEIYTLSLHDALPICAIKLSNAGSETGAPADSCLDNSSHVLTLIENFRSEEHTSESSHMSISYAVFCLKKKKKKKKTKKKTKKHITRQN